VSLIGEGAPQERDGLERYQGARALLGDLVRGQGADETPVGTGEHTWPPPLSGLVVLVDEAALAPGHPLFERLSRLGAFGLVARFEASGWARALDEGVVDVVLCALDAATAASIAARGWARFRGTRGLTPSAREGDALWCMAADLGDAVRAIDHLRAAPIPGDRCFVPHAEPRFLASFLAAPRPPELLVVAPGAEVPKWWEARPVRRLAVDELPPDATPIECFEPALAHLDQLLESGGVVVDQGSVGLARLGRLARAGNLPLVSFEASTTRVVLAGARFGDGSLLRAVSFNAEHTKRDGEVESR